MDNIKFQFGNSVSLFYFKIKLSFILGIVSRLCPYVYLNHLILSKNPVKMWPDEIDPICITTVLYTNTRLMLSVPQLRNTKNVKWGLNCIWMSLSKWLNNPTWLIIFTDPEEKCQFIITFALISIRQLMRICQAVTVTLTPSASSCTSSSRSESSSTAHKSQNSAAFKLR